MMLTEDKDSVAHRTVVVVSTHMSRHYFVVSTDVHVRHY